MEMSLMTWMNSADAAEELLQQPALILYDLSDFFCYCFIFIFIYLFVDISLLY